MPISHRHENYVVTTLAILGAALIPACSKSSDPPPDKQDPAKPTVKAQLLAELPAPNDTPDGMCLLPNGDVIVTVPNVNSWMANEDKTVQDPPPVLLKITKDNKIESTNPDVGFGADGLTFDSKGNLYCGNFADGLLHKITFDEQGNAEEPTVFAKAPFMKSCDGIFCDLETDKIYIADSLANAVQVVSPDGSVRTLAADEENDGSGGKLDQPSEVLLRGDEVIATNMDFPVPGGVNTVFDKPYTISVIKLK